jgi:hypothetical protein
MPDTLYKRLGGYDAIAAVCDDLLPRLMGDAQLARFWQNRAEDSLHRAEIACQKIAIPVERLCIELRSRDFLSLAREASKNPFNLNLLRGGDQRRQEYLAERNSDFWSFLRGSLG